MSFYEAIEAGALRDEPAGWIDDAIARLRTATAARPELQSVLAYALACRHEHSGALDAAIAELQAFAKTHPGVTQFAQQRGEFLVQLLRRADRLNEALLVLEELDRACAPEDHAGRAQVHGLRSQSLLERGLVQRAAEELELELAQVAALADPDERDELLLLATMRSCEVSLAAGRSGDVVRRLAALIDERRHDVSTPRLGQMLLHLGVAASVGADAEASREQAIATLREALATDTLDAASENMARCKITELLLVGGNAPAARTEIATLEALHAGTQLPSYGRSQFLTLRAAVRRASGDRSSLREPRDALTAAFHDWLATQRELPVRFDGQAVLHLDHWSRVVGELIELEIALATTNEGAGDGAAAALDHVLDLQQIGTLSRALAAPRQPLAVIQDALRATHSTAIVYQTGPQRSHAFFIDGHQVTHHVLPPKWELRARATDLAQALAAADPEQPSSAARIALAAKTAAAVFLPPSLVGAMGTTNSLLLVGTSLVGDVCFEALPWDGGDEQAHLLGEVLATTYLGDLSFAVAATGNATVKRPLRLLLAAQLRPDAATAATLGVQGIDVPPLADLDAAVALYDSAASRVVRDDVTISRFLQLDFRSADVVQLLAHGTQREHNDLARGLALADGVLWPETLHDAGFRAGGIVIVSACESGRGLARPGDGTLMTNLGGALLWRGAAAAVLSDAPLDLLCEARFLRRFHSALVQPGCSPARALASTRASFAGESAGWRYQHAQRRVFGAGHRPLGD